VYICRYRSLLGISRGRSYRYTSLLAMRLSDADKSLDWRSLDFEDLEEGGACVCSNMWVLV